MKRGVLYLSEDRIHLSIVALSPLQRVGSWWDQDLNLLWTSEPTQLLRLRGPGLLGRLTALPMDI
jgi:hypothetical protein